MSWKNLNLWKHQNDSVNMANRYIREYRNGRSDGTALIRIPTGTGKSGIIAVISQLLYTSESSLVVVPSEYLRDQIAKKIRLDFWSRIEANLGDNPIVNTPTNVSTFIPSTLDDALNKSGYGKGTLVCTIQTLEAIHRPLRKNEGNQEQYNKLKKSIGYVLFDEGHREPAPIWAQACRELEKPLLLFSATPYRNDYKMFNINEEYTLLYTHQLATSSHYIRNIKFEEISYESSSDFANRLLNFYKEKFDKSNLENIDEPRVIVRCKSKQSVIEITNALRKMGSTAIGIHYDLPNGPKHYYNNVPSPEDENSIFWVHQFMLVEGIDDPRFRILAIYEGFSNARSLVQQIGRIIRNPGQLENQAAYVLSHKDHLQQEYWRNYLLFERDAKPENVDIRNLPIAILDKQPSIRYVGRNYRRRFNPQEDNIHLHFKYPKKAYIFQLNTENNSTNNWDPEKIGWAIKEEWEKGDRYVYKIENPDPDTIVIPYTIIKNSPTLLKTYFLEIDLGFTICCRDGEYIFYYDTQRSIPEVIKSITKIIRPRKLKRLLVQGSRTTSISLINSDLSESVPRSRTLNAYSIKNVAPGLVDHAYFPSRIQAYVPNSISPGSSEQKDEARYLGFTSGLLSERSSKEYDFFEFIEWVRNRASMLRDEKARLDNLVQRYALYVDPPKNCNPKHILIDVFDILDEEIFIHKDTKEPLHIASSALEVNDEKFIIRANDKNFEVSIKYLKENEIYKLQSKELDAEFVMDSNYPEPHRGLVKYLNINQSFTIIPEGSDDESWVIYSSGTFYQPNPILRREMDILNIFRPITELSLVSSEKGKNNSADGEAWDPDSIFGLIDNDGVFLGESNNYEINQISRKEMVGKSELHTRLSNMDILICDDPCYEMADFIVVNKKENFVAFIHAKFGKNKLSGSEFHDVCSQATKNLEYMTPSSNLNPPNINLWDQPWNGGKIGFVSNRIRRGLRDPNNIWSIIKSVIRNPISRREVWVIIGGNFRIEDFRAECNKESDPKANAVSLYYLLQSTWGAITSAGASFRVYCPDHSD